MDQHNVSHHAVYERYVLQSYAKEEWDWELENFDMADEFYESEGDFYGDLEQDDQVNDFDWHSETEEDDRSSDALEFVHFGKGMEFDGGQWVWAKDLDLWWVMDR